MPMPAQHRETVAITTPHGPGDEDLGEIRDIVGFHIRLAHGAVYRHFTETFADLFLRQIQVRKGLGEVPVDRTVSQADVKAHDIADLPEVLITRAVRGRDGDRLSMLCWHRHIQNVIVSIAYKDCR